MLEAMISSGAGGNKTYPDSGPGPKTLKNGSEDLGYFGSLLASEFFTLEELRKQTDFWIGTDNAPSPTWVKMFLDKKIIYIPTQPLVIGVGWNALYAKGLVYGTDDTGVVPGTPAVNQLVYVSKQKESFKVRLFKSQVADPASHGGLEAIGTSAVLKAAEWGRVISAIVSPRQNGYTGDNWALFPVGSSLLAGTSLAVSQNTRQADQTSDLGINNTQVGLIPKSSNGYIWFPLLEYTPGLAVYRSHDPLYGMPVTKAAPALYTDPSYEGAVIRHRAISGSPITPAITLVGNVGYEDPVYKVAASKVKIQNAPILPTITNPVSYE